MDEKINIIIEMIEEIQPYIDFNEKTDLFDEEVLDSVSLLVLVQEIEETFSIEIEPVELTKDNFRSVENILAFVNCKVI